MKLPSRQPRRRRTPPPATLRDYLRRAGVTQTALAKRIGTSQGHVSKIARGHQVPRADLAAKLTRYTRVPIDSFIRVHLAWRKEGSNGRD